MKIAFITFGHIDVSLPLIKYISREVNIDLFIMFAQNRKSESIVNCEDINVKKGFIDKKVLYEILGQKIRQYIGASFKYHIFIYKNLKFKSFSNILFSYKLCKVLQRENYDCIHFNGNDLRQFWISIFTANIPKVFTIHDFVGHSGERGKWGERFNKFLMFSKTQKIIHSANIIKHFNLHKHNVNCIYYGPLEVYKLWQNGAVFEDNNTLLFFGRISPYKGIEYLVDAVPIIKKSIPDLKVIIVGKGKFNFDVEHIRNDDTYEIINRYIPNDELVKLIQKASLIICPYTEATQSGVIMTAYAFNKPVVASAVGGIPEVVEDNVTGRVVPPKNPQVLANVIIDLLSHPKKREQMKRNIEKKCSVGKLSWDYIAKQTIEVYKKAVKSKNL